MSDTPKQIGIIIRAYRETWLQSIISDITTLALGFGFMLPGLYLGSDAMQWLGFIVFMFAIFAKASGKAKVFKTKQDAIDYINSLED